MGLGDRMKSWFIIEDENASKKTKKSKSTAKKEAKSSSKPSPKKASTTSTPATVESGKVTTKFMEILLAVS